MSFIIFFSIPLLSISQYEFITKLIHLLIWFINSIDKFQVDLKSVLHTLYVSGATGFIIWGSSNDVNTKEKCIKLLNYLDNTLGPNIAKYTKANTIYRDEDYKEEDANDNSTTTERNNYVTELDPEFHWIPPENYTHNIKENVEEEIRKKNKTIDNKFSTDDQQNDSVLISLILNSINNENASNADNKQNHINIDASHRTEYLSKNSKKGYPITDHGIEGFVYTTKGPYLFNDKSTTATISATKDYSNLNINTSTIATNSFSSIDNYATTVEIDLPKDTHITTEASTLKTESPNFTSSSKTKTDINSDLITKTESSKSEQENTESVTDLIEYFTTEHSKTVLIEDVTENEVSRMHFFNQNTFLKNYNTIDTTESIIDQTTDYRDTNELKDFIQEDLQVFKSTGDDLNFGTETNIEDCIDCTTEYSSKTYNFSQSIEVFEDSSVPNQVVVI